MLVNSEPSSSWQNSTDNFIAQREYYRYVCNDYISSSVSNGVVRLQFQPSNQRPVIVVINAVTNSPSHRPYELLINEGHYSQTQYDDDIIRWRQIIDSVQAPLPVLMGAALTPEEGTFVFTVAGQPDATYNVEASTNFTDWSVIASNLANGAMFMDTNAPSYGQRFYRVRE